MRVAYLERANALEAIPSLGLIVVSVGYALYRVLFTDFGFPTDFQYIHLAAQMWAEGANPYSPEFQARGGANFILTTDETVWFYPPSSWPLVTPFATLDFVTGTFYWRLLGALAILAGCAVLAVAALRDLGTSGLIRVAGMTAFAVTCDATFRAFGMGQTSPWLFLGVCLGTLAFRNGNRILMAIALFFLMLKPQFGLMVSVFLLASRFWWPALLGGAAISIAASLPALHIAGFGSFVSQYLGQLAIYDSLEVHRSIDSQGVRNLIYHAFGLDLPGMPFLIAGMCLCFAVGSWHVSAPGRIDRYLAWGMMILLGLNFAHLKPYDITLIVVFAVVAARFGWLAQIVMLLGAGATYQYYNVAQLAKDGRFGIDLTSLDLDQSIDLINSGALFAMLLAVLTIAWARSQSPMPQRELQPADPTQ